MMDDDLNCQRSDAIGERLGPFLMITIHGMGIIGVAAALAAIVFPLAHAGLIWSSLLEHHALGQLLFVNAIIHLVLSAIIWFGGASAIETIRRKKKRRRPMRRRVTAKARGSVYVEFLAVFPIFLLLTFGLIQLALINLGGALAHVASYQAARAVWVWAPEMQSEQVVPGPAGAAVISEDDVADRARIAASLVMTPVAPGDYVIDAGDELSDELLAMREAMTARFIPGGGSGASIYDLMAVNTSSESLVKAFDSASIPERAFRKFTLSYLSTDIISVITEPDRVGVHFGYYQYMALPIVNHLFGHHDHPTGARGGSYFRWDIEYTLTPQRHRSNRSVP